MPGFHAYFNSMSSDPDSKLESGLDWASDTQADAGRDVISDDRWRRNSDSSVKLSQLRPTFKVFCICQETEPLFLKRRCRGEESRST